MDETSKKPGKSDRTRAAILAAARELFAAEGFERATIRDIAARAAIDPALVIRYFGSKEGLFARAADFDLRLPDFAGLDPLGDRPGDRGALPGDLGRRGRQWRPDHPAALGGVERDRGGEAAATCSRDRSLPALARAGGGSDAAARAGLVSSQLLGLALCRYVLKLPPLVAMPRERVVRDVGATVQRYLGGAG